MLSNLNAIELNLSYPKAFWAAILGSGCLWLGVPPKILSVPHAPLETTLIFLVHICICRAQPSIHSVDCHEWFIIAFQCGQLSKLFCRQVSGMHSLHKNIHISYCTCLLSSRTTGQNVRTSTEPDNTIPIITRSHCNHDTCITHST